VTKPSALIVDEELARRTTQRLVGKLEAVALVVQAVGLTSTATIDKLLPDGRELLYALAGLHALLAVVILRKGGPFRWGLGWAGLWLGLVFIMPLVMAHIAAPADYGSSPACVPLCGYPSGPFLIMAFYPWVLPRFARIRPAFEVAMILGIGVEQFLLIDTLHGNLTSTNVTSVASSLVGNVTAFAVGKAVGSMCRRAAQAQLELQHHNYEEFFNFLHSHVRGCIVAIQKEGVTTDGAVTRLRYLDQIVTERRLQMMRFTNNVPLAGVFKEHLRLFEHAITIGNTPQVGTLSVDRVAAALIDRALGDLLGNAVRHARSIDVAFALHDGRAVLQVSDDGPGLPAGVLDDPSSSLYRLRRNARQLGGDLVVEEGTRGGACLALSVPIRTAHPRQRSAYP
jgi:hypothetical protein